MARLAASMNQARSCSGTISALRARADRLMWTCGPPPRGVDGADWTAAEIVLNFENLRIAELISALQAQGLLSTGLQLEGEIQDTVTIWTSEPLLSEDVCPVILGQLQILGLRAQARGDQEVSVAAAQGHVSCDATILVTRDPADLELSRFPVTVVAPLGGISGQEAVSLLVPLATAETLILAPPQGGLVFLVGGPADLKPLLRALSDADR
jgi:hypothetical protein